MSKKAPKPKKLDVPVCPKCGLARPGGVDTRTGLCWLDRFPRP